MQKALDNFLFGLCFGVGFAIASGICHILAALFGNARIG